MYFLVLYNEIDLTLEKIYAKISAKYKCIKEP